MASVFFNNFQNRNEQDLIDSLIIESISIYGHEMYYCPRVIVAKDDIYGEDTISEYNSARLTDFYIKSYESYEGDGTFMSKFNLQIRDQMRFQIAMRTFEKDVIQYENIDRPREGDLIYSPMMRRLFVVMYVNKQPIFYQMGSLQLYELTCEVFEYSNERFNTGIPDIDSIQADYSFVEEQSSIITNNNFAIVDNTGNTLTTGQFDFETQNGDTYADNMEIEEEGKDLVDWSDRDPFGEGLF